MRASAARASSTPRRRPGCAPTRPSGRFRLSTCARRSASARRASGAGSAASSAAERTGGPSPRASAGSVHWCTTPMWSPRRRQTLATACLSHAGRRVAFPGTARGERTVMRSGLVLLAVAALAAPAAAYHRQTPPIVSYTSGGDTPLPRLAADGRRFAVAIAASGQQIFRLDRTRNFLEQLTTVGDNANPTTSLTGSIVAWDSDCTLLGCPETGRQIFMRTNLGTTQVTHDLSGTSRNPSVSGHGTVLAFESSGDLGLGTNPSGTPQIFIRTLAGAFTQVTHGAGTSGDPVLDRTGRHIVFESTNDAQGVDTHVSQIWLGPTPLPTQLTNGAGSSRRAAISSDGKLVAFESTADLTGDLHDTDVPNIFTYEVALRK